MVTVRSAVRAPFRAHGRDGKRPRVATRPVPAAKCGATRARTGHLAPTPGANPATRREVWTEWRPTPPPARSGAAPGSCVRGPAGDRTPANLTPPPPIARAADEPGHPGAPRHHPGRLTGSSVRRPRIGPSPPAPVAGRRRCLRHAVDEHHPVGPHRRHHLARHDHADQVEGVGGVDDHPLAAAGHLADVGQLLGGLGQGVLLAAEAGHEAARRGPGRDPPAGAGPTAAPATAGGASRARPGPGTPRPSGAAVARPPPRPGRRGRCRPSGAGTRAHRPAAAEPAIGRRRPAQPGQAPGRRPGAARRHPGPDGAEAIAHDQARGSRLPTGPARRRRAGAGWPPPGRRRTTPPAPAGPR